MKTIDPAREPQRDCCDSMSLPVFLSATLTDANIANIDGDVGYIRADCVGATIAAEREACAKLAEEIGSAWKMASGATVGSKIAAAIRERG